MTLVIAWRRKLRGVDELIIASDSKLKDGLIDWNCAPKILALPRSDAVLAFAGRTSIAYPAALQVIRALSPNPAHIERRYDITDLAHYVQEILNQTLDERVIDPIVLKDSTDDMCTTQLVLAGWSWRHQKFYIWKYHYDTLSCLYKRRKVSPSMGGTAGAQIAFIGDVAQVAGTKFKADRLASGDAWQQSLDMEPFELLRDLIRSGAHESIGGIPQVFKVYRHMNVQAFGVAWHTSATSSPIYSYGGRPLLDYERAFYSFIDSETPSQHSKYA